MLALHALRRRALCRVVPTLVLQDTPRKRLLVVPVRALSSTTASGAKAEKSLYKDQNDTWVDKYAPDAVAPYLKLIRIDRPVGTWLLLWPGWWTIALAAPPGSLPDLKLLTTFGIGALVMRGAGCTINDMWDRKYDAHVARTRERPIASGRISPFQALVYLGGQLSVGLAVLLSLNWNSIYLGAASLGLVVVYPLMKRYSNWPQLVLGLTFNWGVLLGWCAATGAFSPAVLPMYGAGVAWTMVYDTLYAHQDKEDDAALGLKSTALTLGDKTVPVLNAMALAAAGGLAWTGYLVDAAWPYYLGSTAAVAHMLWQVNTANLNDRWSLTNRFVSNKWTGALVFLGAAASSLIQ